MINEYKLKHIYMVYCGLNKVKYKPEHRVTNINRNIGILYRECFEYSQEKID